MSKHIFTVNNMTCDGCVATIRQGLEADTRIQTVDIKLAKKKVMVTGDLTAEEAAENIRNSGYNPIAGQQKKGILGNLFQS